MVRLLRCLFVVLASVVVCRAIDVPLCDRSLCSCPVPNGQIGDAVKVDDGTSLGCLCACGKELGAPCDTDDHCSVGTSCAYPKNLGTSNAGMICRDKCTLTKCGQYERCSLDDSYQPSCSTRSFDCDPSVNAPVVATCLNAKETFPNKCFMANANNERRMSDPTAQLWTVAG